MLYLDTSASAKLLLEEHESAALVAFLTASDQLLLTSRIGVIELRRVARRGGVGADRADAIVSTLAVAEIDGAIERIAIGLDPGLRAFDAIHLATAVAAGTALRAFVCYDVRLARAADDLGLEVATPGA